MNREDLAASALLALPVAIREARGEEILGTLLDCGRPRVTCPEHGTIQVRLPWAEPLSRFTTRFESWAVDQLSECSDRRGPPAAHQLGRDLGADGARRGPRPGRQGAQRTAARRGR